MLCDIIVKRIEADGLERGGESNHSDPLRARVVVLVGLKQLSAVRLEHPLMLRQALKEVQHLCVHADVSAKADVTAPKHAELQD
jgi:hypothetical protein